MPYRGPTAVMAHRTEVSAPGTFRLWNLWNVSAPGISRFWNSSNVSAPGSSGASTSSRVCSACHRVSDMLTLCRTSENLTPPNRSYFEFADAQIQCVPSASSYFNISFEQPIVSPERVRVNTSLSATKQLLRSAPCNSGSRSCGRARPLRHPRCGRALARAGGSTICRWRRRTEIIV